jgi:microcystin-dependent protein
MADSYIGEIRIFACNFPPKNWAQCNGQILSIAQNTALFSILGTTYGGNGQTTFALPNLQGAAPIGQGQGLGLSSYALGQTGGTSTVTLAANQMPSHTHNAVGTDGSGTAASPANAIWASPSIDRDINFYEGASATTVNMNGAALALLGGSQAHNNLMPYQAQNFCITLFGIFPARN